MTALQHIDHGVLCDHTLRGLDRPCVVTVWRDEIIDELRNKSIKGFRDELRRRGWQLGVLPETLGINDRQEPLDFCPDHRKDRT